MSSETEEEGFEPDTSPVAQSTIDSLPSVTITDPSLLCSICTNHFGPGPEPDSVPETDNSVSLPCGHVYHSECIVPWLRRRNSCPLCRCPLYRRRFRLPRDDVAVADRDAEVARDADVLSEFSLRVEAQPALAELVAALAATQTELAAEQADRAATQAEWAAALAERTAAQADWAAELAAELAAAMAIVLEESPRRAAS